MAGKSCSDTKDALKLRRNRKISKDKPVSNDLVSLPDQTCPKCNGEGYIVVRVYPWDGCSYDEKPCELCNPKNDEIDF
jgi:DnaJ-class molecular chaperone